MTSRKPPASLKADTAGNLEEDIRHLAYGFYEQRGREDGRDLDDWVFAEKEITKKRSEVAS